MRRVYRREVAPLAYTNPSVNLIALGGLVLMVAGVCALARCGLSADADVPILGVVVQGGGETTAVALAGGVAALTAAAVVHRLQSDSAKIRHKVRRALCHPSFGNPLHLQDGELLPHVNCREIRDGVYELTVTAGSCTVETIADAASAISSSLNKRYQQYAVTQVVTDTACNHVVFCLDDVTTDRSITASTVEALRQDTPTQLVIEHGTYIDLTRSGSMIVAGKTRSGKTTGVIALLIQVLLSGPDRYGSCVLVVDPKQAELSRLPHVISLDSDGEATTILAALRRFAATVVARQKVLNALSEQAGDAVHWWDADMHPCILFLDEFVALRDIYPAKPTKDSDYCRATFDALLKRIMTTGASAGCYVIISIAEASVGEGGLPNLIKNAASTKILFRPTVNEGAFLWDSRKLEALKNDRVYQQGDAWYTSEDGDHEQITCVHFPRMTFQVYRELGRLLREYYDENHAAPAQ